MKSSKVQLPGFAELLRRTEDTQRSSEAEQLAPLLNQFETYRGSFSIPESRNQVSPVSSIHSFRSELSVTSSYTNNGQSRLPSGMSATLQSPGVRQLYSTDLGIVSTGWLDTDNWLFKIVWEAAKDYSIDELTEKFFGRRQRPVYGETHKSSLRKHEGGKMSEDHRWHKSSKDKSKENHQQQERHRRKRHRVLQRESDGCVGDFIFALANEKLPYVKSVIMEMFPEDESDGEGGSFTGRGGNSNACNLSKNTGKDENLLSAVFTHLFSAIVVLKQHHARIEVKQMLRSIRMENHRLREELREFHTGRADTSTPYLSTEIPSRKRTACEVYSQEDEYRTRMESQRTLTQSLAARPKFEIPS